MSEMNEGGDAASSDEAEGRGALDRRSMIKTGMAVGAAAWIVPQVVSMSAAAAASNTCNSFFENFNSVVPNGFQTYNAPATVAGWTVSGSVDTIQVPQYGSGSFAPALAGIDLEGSPGGPGGISKSFSLDCATMWTVEFDAERNDFGTLNDTSLTIVGAGVVPALFFNNANGASHPSISFALAAPALVTLIFATTATGSGNNNISNISIHT